MDFATGRCPGGSHEVRTASTHSACPHCSRRIGNAGFAQHLKACSEKAPQRRVAREVASGKAAWMASGAVVCHYLADFSSRDFACGVKLGDHRVVSASDYSQCVACRRVLGLPVAKRSKKRRKPKPGTRLVLWSGGGFETSRRRH